jgi:hypothetical protein
MPVSRTARVPAAPIDPSRRRVLRAAGAGLAGALLDACGGSSGTSGAISQPVPTGPVVPAMVTVSNSEIGTVPPAFTGLSYEKESVWQPCFEAANTNLVGLFRGLGSSLLRIGGATVDQTQWVPDGPGRTSGQVSPPDVDALAAFLDAAGWKCLYGINLATSTPPLAAAEVAYAAQALGSRLYGIEIGNECDGYGDAGSYFAGNWTLQDYETRWESFRSAILALSPSVVLTGPASGSPSKIGTWTIPFGQFAGPSQIALLTQHYYRGDGKSLSSTGAELVTPDAALVADLSELNAGAATIGIPFRIAETNSFDYGGAPGVSDSYASSLWVIDHLFHIALGGGAGANLHGGGDGPGYTPIADLNGTVVEARPEYYGLRLFTMAGTGTLLSTSVSAGELDVTAYSLRTGAGQFSIVAVNKDGTNALQLSIDVGQTVQSATLVALTGSGLSALSGMQIQGATVEVDGLLSMLPPYTLTVSGSLITAYVEPLSAVLIKFV